MSGTRQLQMRVSLSGVALSAAECLERLAADLRERDGFNPEDDYATDPAGDADQFAFMLRELSKHARQTAAGEYTAADFADFYCLAEPARKWAGEPNSDRRPTFGGDTP